MGTPRFYTEKDLDGMDKGTLERISEARGLDVTATGTKGAVVIGDLKTAILSHQDRSGINPALQAIPEESVAKRYKVIGSTTVHDTPPGGEFTAIIPPAQESLLFQSGALTIVEDRPDVVMPDEPVTTEPVVLDGEPASKDA